MKPATWDVPLEYDWISRFLGRVPYWSDGCWDWRGHTNVPSGYGRLRIHHRSELTHRLAWMLYVGPIPEGLRVLHSCDNRGCCNPKHLFLGTQKDNMNDCQAKGRFMSLPRNLNPKAKLTQAQVDEIRAAKAAGQQEKDIAARYGISKGHIWNLTKGKQWKNGAGDAASDPAAELPPPLPEDAPAPSIFDPVAISAKVAKKLAKEKAAAK